jgi:hypothetical protein
MGELDRTWVFIVAGVAFLLVVSIRNRKKRVPETKVYARRIEGSQVIAFLHPRVSAACLADHAIQFGKGFRRKEGPALPHDDRCQCRIAPFSYTSTEAFHGALRQPRAPDVSIDSLRSQDALALLSLMRAEAGPPPETMDAYLVVCDLNRFSPDSRSLVEAFLRDRYEFLTTAPESPQPAQA